MQSVHKVKIWLIVKQKNHESRPKKVYALDVKRESLNVKR